MRAQLGFLHMALQLSRHRLLKILFFPPIEWSFYPCWNHLTTDTILLPDSQFFSIDHMCILKSHCFRVCCFSSLHCLQYGGSNSCGMFKAQQSNTTRNTPVTKHLGLVCCSKGEHTYQRFPRVSGEKSSERGILEVGAEWFGGEAGEAEANLGLALPRREAIHGWGLSFYLGGGRVKIGSTAVPLRGWPHGLVWVLPDHGLGAFGNFLSDGQ